VVGSFHSILSVAETTSRAITSRISFQSQNTTNLFWACIVGVYEGFIAMYKTLIEVKRGRDHKESKSCCGDYIGNLLFK